MMSHFFGPGHKVKPDRLGSLRKCRRTRKTDFDALEASNHTDKLTLDARIKAAVLGGRYLAGRILGFVLLR